MGKQKLKACPLCGAESRVIRLGHGSGAATYNVSCGVRDDESDSCSLVLFGGASDRRKDMIAKWNHRTALYTAPLTPTEE